jgi:hypothetical protein
MTSLCLLNYLTEPQKNKLNIKCRYPNCKNKAHHYNNNGTIYYSCAMHRYFVELKCSSCKTYIELGKNTNEIRFCIDCKKSKTICHYCKEINDKEVLCKCNKICEICNENFNSCEPGLNCGKVKCDKTKAICNYCKTINDTGVVCKCNKVCEICNESFNSCDPGLNCGKAECNKRKLICCHQFNILYKKRVKRLTPDEMVEEANIKASELRQEYPDEIINIIYLYISYNRKKRTTITY